jgi:hypothetical protein
LVACSTLSNAAGNTVTGVSDSTNGAYPALDNILNGGVVSAASFALTNAASVPAGLIGTATGGSSTTAVDTTKAWTVNQWVGASLRNVSQGFTVASVLSNTATTLTFSPTSVTNPGDVYALGGYVQTVVSGTDIYPGMVIAEIAGVSTLAGHSGLINNVSSAGVNNLSSGAVALGSSPVIVVGFCFNDTATNTPYVPSAGTTALNAGVMWTFDRGQPTARLQYQNVANPGTTAALFGAQFAPNGYVAFMVALNDAVITGPTPGPVPRTIFIMP